MTADLTRDTPTDRGFITYLGMRDRAGNEVVVRESSLATERCVWLFVAAPDVHFSSSAHLTEDMAREVRDALDRFLADTSGGDRDGTGAEGDRDDR